MLKFKIRSKLLTLCAMIGVATIATPQHGMTKLGFAGDSITASGFNQHGTQDHTRPNSTNQGKYDASWSTQALYSAGGNYIYFRNWAISGAKSTLITDNLIDVALSQTELPDVLVVMMGPNDVAVVDPNSPATIVANYQRLLDVAKPLGVEIVPCTIIPNRNTSATIKSQRLLANVGIREFCRRNKLRMIDLYASVVDGEGLFKADLTGDGIHPNIAGHRAMGLYAAAALKSYSGSSQPWLTSSGGDTDPLNLFPNGAFNPFTTTPDTYVGYPFQSLPDDSIPGVWARFTSTPHEGAKYILRTALVNVQPGHVYETGFRFRTQGLMMDGWGMYAVVTFYDANLTKLEENWMLHAARPVDNLNTSGYIQRILNVAPSGAAHMNLKVIMTRCYETYTVDLAQMTCYDRTSMNLSPGY